MEIFDILRGISGKFEISRVSLVIGGLFATISPIAFEVYELVWNRGHFDVTAWCLSYPGGLVTLVTGGVFAIGNKEKAIAHAQTTVAALPPPKSDD